MRTPNRPQLFTPQVTADSYIIGQFRTLTEALPALNKLPYVIEP